MAQKFYIDTSIWRDYFEDRKDNLRPLGEFAFQFLKKCLKEKDTVLVSREVSRELLEKYSKETVEDIFSSFKEIILKIDYSTGQASEAYFFWVKTNKKFPYADVLHSIIARDNKAILISRDRHFKEIGVIEPMLPEETG